MRIESGLNERQEMFCHEYVRRPVGKSAAAAAGYEASSTASQACRLLARADIQERIAALRANIARQQCHDADAVLANLQSIFELALVDHQYATAVRAVTLQARIAGLLPGTGSRQEATRDAAGVIATPQQEAPAQEAPAQEASTQDTDPAPMPIDDNECQPFDATQPVPMSTDDNQCETSGSLPPAPAHHETNPGADPSPMSTNVNVCALPDAKPAPNSGINTLYTSGRKRRTLSGRRK